MANPKPIKSPTYNPKTQPKAQVPVYQRPDGVAPYVKPK